MPGRRSNNNHSGAYGALNGQDDDNDDDVLFGTNNTGRVVDIFKSTSSSSMIQTSFEVDSGRPSGGGDSVWQDPRKERGRRLLKGLCYCGVALVVFVLYLIIVSTTTTTTTTQTSPHHAAEDTTTPTSSNLGIIGKDHRPPPPSPLDATSNSSSSSSSSSGATTGVGPTMNPTRSQDLDHATITHDDEDDNKEEMDHTAGSSISSNPEDSDSQKNDDDDNEEDEDDNEEEMDHTAGSSIPSNPEDSDSQKNDDDDNEEEDITLVVTHSTTIPPTSPALLVLVPPPPPPMAMRDETRFVSFGVAPADWPDEIPRQSQMSRHPLLDPPKVLPDPYGWMRDDTRTDSTVLDHIQHENDYTDHITSHLRQAPATSTTNTSTASTSTSTSTLSIQDTLFEEYKSFLQETDFTLPRPNGNFLYYDRTFEGWSYRFHVRAPRTTSSSDETYTTYTASSVIPVHMEELFGGASLAFELLPGERSYLNENDLCYGQSYCAVGSIEISPSQQYVAYTVDLTGSETYQLHVKYIQDQWGPVVLAYPPSSSSSSSPEEEEEGDDEQKDNHNRVLIPALSETIVWGPNDRTLYYLVLDEEHRPYQVYQKTWNTDLQGNKQDAYHPPPSNNDYTTDVLMFEELDDLFWVGIGTTLDRQYLLIETSSTESSEIHYLKLTNITTTTTTTTTDSSPPTTTTPELSCIAPRRPNVLYQVEHRKGMWWLASNVDETPNMRMYTAPVECDPAENNNKYNNTATTECPWSVVVLEPPRSSTITTTTTTTTPTTSNSTATTNDTTNAKVPIEQPLLLFDGSDVIGNRVVEDVSTFDSMVVLQGREDGIPRIWILYLCPDDENDDEAQEEPCHFTFQRLEFPEPAHDVYLAKQFEFDLSLSSSSNSSSNDDDDDEDSGIITLVVEYSSLVTPLQYIAIPLHKDRPDLANDFTARTIVQQRRVPGYDKDLYETDRIMVPSRDGHTNIPVSLVYRKDTLARIQNDSAVVPMHLYAYGTYGQSMDVYFRTSVLPLLNRGMVYAIAHVRGGGEMGRQWYEAPNGGKYLCKRNTFHDFVDVARYWTEVKQWTTPSLLSCEGRSAGGMTMGASINEAPELFRMAILGVPFVDLMATMVDASIPLTAGEWEEWGNPSEEEFFDYMLSYSPMNNVRSNVTYPSMLITGGLWDPRVQYYEPTKFAATVRYAQRDRPDRNPVMLKIDNSSGHFSASDRYQHLKQQAFEYSVLLDQMGLLQP